MKLLLEEMTKRIEELETQVAFQDQLHETLNATIVRQDKEILELKQYFRLMNERLKEIGDDSGGTQPQDETPPHY